MAIEVLAIDGGYFYAGVVLENGVVVETAPIVRKHFQGKQREFITSYCQKRRWKILVVMKVEHVDF